MLKKILLLSGLLFINNIFSQSIEIEYENRTSFDESKIANLPEHIKERLQAPTFYTLLSNGKESFFSIKNDINFSNENTSGNKTIRTSFKVQRNNVYKNLNNNALLIDTEVGGKDYLVSDKLPKIEWNITEETKQFGEYLLRKATTNYNNRNVVAWFSDKIEISDGPNLYNGLPGLILRLEMGNTIYNVSKIKYLDDLTIPKPTEKGKIQTSLNEYREILEQSKPKVGEERGENSYRKVIRIN